MVDTAALLVDEVLPEVPIRQWVLSVPLPLRFLFAKEPEAMGSVLRIVVRAIESWLIRRSGHRRVNARGGAVTLVQRFGSALNLNIHYHILALDGVYAADRQGRPRFVSVPAPPSVELDHSVGGGTRGAGAEADEFVKRVHRPAGRDELLHVLRPLRRDLDRPPATAERREHALREDADTGRLRFRAGDRAELADPAMRTARATRASPERVRSRMQNSNMHRPSPGSSTLERRGDRVDGKEHRQRLAVKHALPNPFDRDEAKRLIELHRLGFGVSHDADTADPVALLNSHREHMAEQGLADAQALRAGVHTQTGKSQHRQRIGRQPLAQTFARHVGPLH
jgi:hypothetical protein